MKKIVFTFFLSIISLVVNSQNVGIGTVTPHSSAALDISSTDKGLLVPRITHANRPISPATGLLIYQTDNTPGYYYYDGSGWVKLSVGGITGSGTANYLALFNGSNSVTSNNNLLWDGTSGRLNIFGINNGAVGNASNWIAANIGGSGGNRVVAGILNGEATIGAHNATLTSWATLKISDVGGTIKMPGIAGTTTQMVTVASDGTLGSQAIPNSGSGTVTNVSAASTAGNPITVSNGNSTPIINIPAATSSANGYLSSTDWSTFNSKQNILGNASTTTNGILTSADWNTFNNKTTLPSLTAGSLLFSNGTTLAQNNANLFWDNTNNSLGIGTTIPLAPLSVNSSNNGTVGAGFANWIAGNFGGTAGNRVILGVQNGEATIGAHNAALNAWATLTINPAGAIKMPSINNTGTKMVTVAADGTISAQAIPINDNMGNHTATQNINLAANKLVGNGGTNGINIASNGNVSTDSVLTVAGTTSLNNTLSVSGATTLSNSLNVTGQTTLSNLAGTGNRMLISDATGVISTQAIPTGGDNMGNHTATQSLNLNNQWISNNGTSAGLRVDNSGNVGVNLAAPQGVFDVGKVVTGYTGTYSANLSPTAASIYSFSTFNPDVPTNAADGLKATIWQGNSNNNNQVVGFDFGASNAKTIRIYVAIFEGFSAENFTNCSFNFQASHDGSNWFTLDSRTVVNTAPFPPFTIVRPFAINNTTAYRHYRIQFTSFVYGTARTPWISELQMSEEIIATNTVSGGLTALSSGNIGVGTNTPTANLDVVGSLRLRNGAANNAILVSDANGNATWNATPSFVNATITNATTTNLGVGIAATTSNSITTSGTGGIKVSSSNGGAGTADWIASNVGGQNGDRVVSGNLESKATIGAHFNNLSSWADLVINPTTASGATVTIGSTANASPTSTNNTSALNTKLVVNGSIRQGYYAVPVSIPANSLITVTWTHNLGYGPILMMSTDENGGGSNMDYCNVTTYNNNTNQTSFKIRNTGGSTATGGLRWILVW